MARTLAAVGLAIALAVGTAPSSLASPKDQGAALRTEADALRKKGDVAGALTKYLAAHELLYSPVTGFEIGRCQLDLGRLVEAREAFLAVARIEVSAKEPQAAKKAREESARLADDLATRIPTLLVRPVNLPEKLRLEVSVDGVALPEAAVLLPRKVNPGPHTVIATLVGRDETRSFEVQLAEGETKEIVVEFHAEASKAVVPPAPLPLPPPPRRAADSTTGYVTYGGFTLGGVALVIGGAAGFVALGKAASLRDACLGGHCPPSAHDTLTAGRTASTISTISFIAAGVGVIIGAYGLVRSPATGATGGLRVRAYVGLAGGGLSGQF